MNNKGYIAIIVALLLTCAFLAYNLSERSGEVTEKTEEVESLEIDRRELELDLQKMRFSYDTLRTENTVLMAEMADQRSQIDELLNKVKDRNYSINKLQKETGTLREIMKGYVYTIDSLNTLNQALMAENSEMKNQVDLVTSENRELQERQQNMEGLIATGQVLQTTELSATAIKLRNNGKQVDIRRAGRADMIKSCFTILENRIAKPGDRELYMRIVGPDGNTLPSKDGVVVKNFGEEGELNYSVMRNVEYNNAEMEVCIFYTIPDGFDLSKGDYKLFIYEGEVRIGVIDMALK